MLSKLLGIRFVRRSARRKDFPRYQDLRRIGRTDALTGEADKLIAV